MNAPNDLHVHGPVGVVTAGDVHNHVNPFGRALTKAERVELNDLVKILDDEYGYPGWETWQYLHKTIGFEGIDAMCIGHRDAAIELLKLRIHCSELQRATPDVPKASFELAQKGNELAELNDTLKQTRLDLSRLHTRYTAEKKRADEADANLTKALAEIKSNRGMLAKAHDQIGMLKADVMRFRKRSNRLVATIAVSVVIAAACLFALANADKIRGRADVDEMKINAESGVAKKGAKR